MLPRGSGATSHGLMEWSALQGNILTGGGRLVELYKPPLFPFAEEELPHYHKVRGATRPAFEDWRAKGRSNAIAAGAWTRPLFMGGFAHTDASTERTYNLQTPSIFLDLRLPTAGDFSRHSSLATMSPEELRLFARRHAFAGYTLVNAPPFSVDSPPVAVRHHAIDWNFVGALRPRPNKWRIEMDKEGNTWKEWGWARDEYGQHVYCERWERLPDGFGPYVALRSADAAQGDAFLIVCGNHFGLVEDRPTKQPFDAARAGFASLQALVDALIGEDAAKNRAEVEAYLSLRACHGLVAAPGGGEWVIDAAIHPWEEGRQLIKAGDMTVNAQGSRAKWGGREWDVVECSLPCEQILKALKGARMVQTSRL